MLGSGERKNDRDTLVIDDLVAERHSAHKLGIQAGVAESLRGIELAKGHFACDCR
jgi:hypothetical protein